MKTLEVGSASIKEAMDKEIRTISIRNVHVPSNRRGLQSEAVTQLVDSMRAIGLRTPITVYQDKQKNQPVLVTGLHRLEAAKKLGWETIDALFFTGTPEERRMWEIAENLHRLELTALERSDQIAEWIRLAEQRAEEVKTPAEDNKLSQVATVSKGGRGKESGVRAAARELRINKDDAYRAMQVASLSKEAKQVARETGLDNNRTALLKAAKAANSADFLRKEHARRDQKPKSAEEEIPPAAQDFADWLYEQLETGQFPRLISWLEHTRPRDVIRALRKKHEATAPPSDGKPAGSPGRGKRGKDKKPMAKPPPEMAQAASEGEPDPAVSA